MTRLPALKPKKVLQALQRAGFFIHHTTGSYYALRHRDKPHAKVTIPYHNVDLKRRVLHSILKQAHLSEEQLLDLL